MKRGITPVVKLCLNISEASRAIGVRDARIRDLILRGELIARTIGGANRKMILVDGPGALQQYLQRQPVAPVKRKRLSHGS
jgi:hypothetical protein